MNKKQYELLRATEDARKAMERMHLKLGIPPKSSQQMQAQVKAAASNARAMADALNSINKIEVFTGEGSIQTGSPEWQAVEAVVAAAQNVVAVSGTPQLPEALVVLGRAVNTLACHRDTTHTQVVRSLVDIAESLESRCE